MSFEGPPWPIVLLVMFGKWAVILVVSIFAAPIGFVMHLVFAFLLMATGNIMMLARRPRSKLA